LNEASKQPLFKKSGAKIFMVWAVGAGSVKGFAQTNKKLLFLQKKKRLPFPVLSLPPA
jgi:hypothetical protein